VDVPPLWTSSEYFFMKIKLIITIVLVESIQILNVARVSVGIGEGKLDTVVFIFEGELENTL